MTLLVFKLIRHPADRPDLAQEVYLKVFENLAGFKFHARLSTWVGQIAYNTCLHYLAKKQLVLLDPAEPAPTGATAPSIAGTAMRWPRWAPALSTPPPST